MTPSSLDSIFCKSILYRTLDFLTRPAPDSPASVRETAPCSGPACTERHVQCVWYDASLRPANLTSDSGEPVRVLDPGRWNLEAGPDFLGATIIVGDDRLTLKGDVEIHLAPRDWTSHGHGADPAYSRVVAHVCLQHGPRPASLPPHSLQIELLRPLRTEGRSHLQDIDVTAYPYSLPSPRATRCSQTFPDLPYETQLTVLSAAGHERLRLKSARISRRLAETEPEQVLYEETMAALGYKHNRTPLRRLAEALPCRQLRDLCCGDAMKAYALLMGKAGLLPNSLPTEADEESRDFLRLLWDHWWRYETTLGAEAIVSEWNTSAVRPQNLPARRIAAAACIFCAPGSPVEILEPRAAIPYWSCRLSLGGKRRERPVALLGAERKAAIMTNIITPFLAACGEDSARVLDSLPPLDFNAVTRQMMNSLMGNDYNASKYRDALIQQGLIQVFSDYCLAPRNTCDECGFAAALRRTRTSRTESTEKQK